MQAELVDLLNPGNRPGRGRDQHVDPICQLTTLLTREADHTTAYFAPLVGSTDHIRRVPTGADGHEDIAGAAEGLHLSREDLLETVVVTDCGQQRSVHGQGDSRQRPPVLLEATHQLGSKMLGVRGAASVAEDQQLVARGKAGFGKLCCLLKFRQEVLTSLLEHLGMLVEYFSQHVELHLAARAA